MYRIKNTSEDRSKTLLHIKAAKFEHEPTIGGQKLKLRTSIIIPDDVYERQQSLIKELISKGIVDAIKIEKVEEVEKVEKVEEVEEVENSSISVHTEAPAQQEETSSIEEVAAPAKEAAVGPTPPENFMVPLPPPPPPNKPVISEDSNKKSQGKKLFR